MINSFVLACKIEGEVRIIETKSGKPMVVFNCCAEYDKGGGYTGKSEHKCKAFGHVAESLLEAGLREGSALVLQGAIETDEFQGKNGPAKSNNFVVSGFETLADDGIPF